MNFPAKHNGGRNLVCAALLLVLAAAPVPAQKNKDKKKDSQKTDSSINTNFAPNDSQEIERTVSEALGYWQIGDVDSLRKYYANDVVVISGSWEPPVIGWDSYLAVYQAQRAHINGARLNRSNTYIKSTGDSAWATYQWQYIGSADGKLFDTRGHTTLILNKQAGRWVITVDHSSAVSETVMEGPAPTAVPSQSGRP